MKKLLAFVDNYILKIGVFFTFLFVALYPKLPSIHIVRTWVYIRLEDFVIAALVTIWLIQLIRKKVKLPIPVGIPLGVYWLSGLITLVICLVFVGPHLVGFFPHLAILEYARRIEYMILFFIAFSAIRSQKDIRDFIVLLCVTLVGVVVYGFGQRFYLQLWALFPKFFEHYSFCFPSFQTGNEEFAKGMALCLPEEARITSTFGGHYDLAAYLVVVLPILLGIFVAAKKLWKKVGIALLFIMSLMLLVFTSSRVSFISYIVAAVLALFFMKKRLLIIPVLCVSVACLLIFSSSTAKRFLETFRIVNVVTNNQGQVIGLAENNLPDALKKKISKTDSVVVEAPPPTQNLPTGSSFITLSQTAVATNGAYVKAPIPTSESERLKMANGGLIISTVSGSFLIQKAIVYDISFTTRFQGEWPNAWAAFMGDPAFGKGYSTITLATDNDFLRLLGESGILGFATFALIFIVLGIFLRQATSESPPEVTYFAYGLAGGVLGLIINAGLIDVFEASKVAEPLWILLGVAVGGLSLTFAKHVDYIPRIKRILLSHVFLVFLLCILVFFMFGGGLNNFFVADDFTWLKWAAVAKPTDLVGYFFDAQGSIYRPIAKILMLVMYSVFAFVPTGYHVLALFVHFFIALLLYVLGLWIFRKKLWAWILAALFIILPIHAETLYWISTISISWCTLFILLSLLAFLRFRQKKSLFLYALSLLFGLLAPFTYEMGVVLPLLLLVTTVYFEKKLTKSHLLSLIPFVVIDIVYLIIRSHAHVASGGDYSYSMLHFIPNVVANFVNYVLTTFIGEKVIAWQYMVRSTARIYTLPITVIFVICIAALAVLLYIFWRHVKKFVLDISFGLLFSFIALLPFLALGNISERYGYLASSGLVLTIVMLAKWVYEKWQSMFVRITLVIIGIAFFVYAKWAVGSELSQWMKASNITYNTLAYFRVVKEDLPAGSTIYVSHMPTRIGDAWIFPVGFEDGLWFVYRTSTPRVVKTQSVDESLSIKHSHSNIVMANEYVFDFDKNGQLLEY